MSNLQLYSIECFLLLLSCQNLIDSITRDIDKALKCLPNKFKSSHILNKPEVCKYINVLHDRFVIIPVDKASNNLSYCVQKKYIYLDVIKNELGISNDGKIIGNNVSKPVYEEAEDIYKFHEQELLNTFSMKLLDNNQYIPLLYWTSKQHKCPYKFRFIAGASKCYNKQLAIELSLALKCIKRHFNDYCKVIEKRTAICYYSSVDISYKLINKISDIKTARSI